jgi:glutaminyl-tRNA synthetase
MYTFAHPIEDALENITHSICTLEFEDQRPFYDWLLERLAEGGLLQRPLPQQIEFSRLNLTYVVLSKRKLIQLVEEKHVEGWDDPRMPTLVGARRRGYSAEGFRLFAERIGVSKNDSLIDYVLFEDAMREVMNESDQRRIAVLDPLKLIIDNYPEGQVEECFAPNHPLHPELGQRAMPFSRELWIEGEDFMEVPSKGYRRLFPGNMARLRYGYVVKCIGCDKDENGKVTRCTANICPKPSPARRAPTASRSRATCTGFPPPTPTLPKSASTTACSRCRPPAPGAKAMRRTLERNFLDDLNPDSRRPSPPSSNPACKDAKPEERFQFERHGYFVADRVDSRDGKPVFNRAVTLKDSWGKAV